ncbi:hypothetical protein EDB81DRAFT_90860 [Dactylonectria macrodidyma]|uniref:Uncharacterized protein n=1 Tax=Dactylonectria macrodidyma TaxID=307937 RepID=A0A9P9EAI9_9HYPO|nr:hypothetical protein EDB81DRAFT_90860 [Dactylonectria macrodidyma]
MVTSVVHNTRVSATPLSRWLAPRGVQSPETRFVGVLFSSFFCARAQMPVLHHHGPGRMKIGGGGQKGKRFFSALFALLLWPSATACVLPPPSLGLFRRDVQDHAVARLWLVSLCTSEGRTGSVRRGRGKQKRSKHVERGLMAIWSSATPRLAIVTYSHGHIHCSHTLHRPHASPMSTYNPNPLSPTIPHAPIESSPPAAVQLPQIDPPVSSPVNTSQGSPPSSRSALLMFRRTPPCCMKANKKEEKDPLFNAF